MTSSLLPSLWTFPLIMNLRFINSNEMWHKLSWIVFKKVEKLLLNGDSRVFLVSLQETIAPTASSCPNIHVKYYGLDTFSISAISLTFNCWIDTGLQISAGFFSSNFVVVAERPECSLSKVNASQSLNSATYFFTLENDGDINFITNLIHFL